MLVAVLAVSLSACGEPESYTVPGEICGRKIDPEIVRPLLPEGEKFEAEMEPIGDSLTRCLLSVDGRNELGIREYPDGGDIDAMKFARENPSRFRNPEKAAFGADTAVSDGIVLSVNPCTYQGKKGHYILEVTVNRFDTAEPDGWRAELERFAKAYLPVGMRETGCE
ncbi:hypothetical protein CUT44_28190 [Streptomyces carminius]|uniref:DUF3558 domain-containing protein n=1 Tax=Streptomyces carminius TaxID=2665496 RepID=A0A2M8LQD5_9ACTN|nr:hypothetical protein [Streptomyces carminius]PJE94174.1 hypothetical protein CUT44_28190 [Streptomyces carminius]